MQKLALYNFSKGSISWFDSYLNKRSQVVKLNKYISTPQTTRCGIPQTNKLTINVQKTKHMFVPCQQGMFDQVKNEIVSILGSALINVSCYKYLRIITHSGLNFETMLDSAYNKANRKLYTPIDYQ